MKTITLSALLLVVAVAAQAETVRLSEPVAETETTETFGSQLDESLPEVSMAILTANPQNYVDQPFQLTTRVAKVCQKKGCFFIAQEGDDILRVSFRDYGFFIPTDSAQKSVTLAGQLSKKTLSEEQAAHFTQDLNDKNTQLKAGEVYEIVADSIRIPKA